ncbi:MAG TPA: hypothetical protein VLF68_04695 [Candidatus Saccharimonadales bacterium]|nr:hypothetical protein [Candidatus Saccharimonadales bacterium]
MTTGPSKEGPKFDFTSIGDAINQAETRLAGYDEEAVKRVDQLHQEQLGRSIGISDGNGSYEVVGVALPVATVTPRHIVLLKDGKMLLIGPRLNAETHYKNMFNSSSPLVFEQEKDRNGCSQVLSSLRGNSPHVLYNRIIMDGGSKFDRAKLDVIADVAIEKARQLKQTGVESSERRSA